MAPWERLKKSWDSFTRTQIADRDELNILDNQDAAELSREISQLVPKIPGVEVAEMERAVEIGKVPNFYYGLARRRIQHPESGHAPTPPSTTPRRGPEAVLTAEEEEAIVAERERLFSQGKMARSIITVSLCSFLQGFLQSSINAASLYADLVGIPPLGQDPDGTRDWKLGSMNAIVYFVAAVVGAPAALGINYLSGRRGAIAISAMLNIAAAAAAAYTVPPTTSTDFVQSSAWVDLLGVRIIAGVAMGIKAVSAPVLASETATGYWRGSTLLSWQLLVAMGIMLGNAVNLGLGSISDRRLALQLILGAPVVPAVATLCSVAYCFESPRFYMSKGTPNYNPDRAFQNLLKVRNTRLQALRDMFLIHWSNKAEMSRNDDGDSGDQAKSEKPGLTYAGQLRVGIKLSYRQYRTLFSTKRLKNAVYTVWIVNLGQQFCGINVFAFYSNTLFGERLGYGDNVALGISLGFGAVNFFFGLLAIRSIDAAGRRTWLLATLPLMTLFLLISALVLLPFDAGNLDRGRIIASTFFIFAFAIAYSPGLGPIPFTLSSESFPLSHRESGASVGIFANLFFAGLLTMLYPKMDSSLRTPGALGIFAFLNFVVFVLVFLYMEETRRLNLEELDIVFGEPKSRHRKYQIEQRLPYIIQRYLLFRSVEPPPTYDEVITGTRERGDDVEL